MTARALPDDFEPVTAAEAILWDRLCIATAEIGRLRSALGYVAEHSPEPVGLTQDLRMYARLVLADA